MSCGYQRCRSITATLKKIYLPANWIAKSVTTRFSMKFSVPNKIYGISIILPFTLGKLVWCEDIEENKTRKFDLPQPDSLSPKQMLEQSSIGVVAASVQLLQITTAAVLIASTSYRKAMEAEMLLLKQSLEFVNVEFMQEGYNDLLIAARAEIQQTQKDLQELLGFMEYVEKTAGSAAETSFLVGAEYSSLSLSDVLFDAQKRVAEQRVHTQSLETELRALQQQVVLKTQQKKKHLTEQEPILPTLPDS